MRSLIILLLVGVVACGADILSQCFASSDAAKSDDSGYKVHSPGSYWAHQDLLSARGYNPQDWYPGISESNNEKSETSESNNDNRDKKEEKKEKGVSGFIHGVENVLGDVGKGFKDFFGHLG